MPKGVGQPVDLGPLEDFILLTEESLVPFLHCLQFCIHKMYIYLHC